MLDVRECGREMNVKTEVWQNNRLPFTLDNVLIAVVLMDWNQAMTNRRSNFNLFLTFHADAFSIEIN